MILEVGMGGKLDATNLIQKPKLCVIASVSMDHMHFLGNSLEKIAAQKAGIIKKGCPVVTLKQDERVMREIQKRCQEMEAPLTIADMEDTSRIDRIHLGLKNQSFRYEKKNIVKSLLKISLDCCVPFLKYFVYICVIRYNICK